MSKRIKFGVVCIGLVAEPASPARAGCLSGPAGLSGKIYGITSLRVDQSEFIRQRVRVQIREYRLLPPMAMKVDLGGKKEFSKPLNQFNLLALLARRNLCIPSTSAPS